MCFTQITVFPQFLYLFCSQVFCKSQERWDTISRTTDAIVNINCDKACDMSERLLQRAQMYYEYVQTTICLHIFFESFYFFATIATLTSALGRIGLQVLVA